MTRRLCLQLISAIIILFQLTIILPAQAATVVVDTPDDDPLAPVLVGCTLREAVNTMKNQSGCSSTGVFGVNDEITFALVDQTPFGAVVPSNQLTLGQLEIDQDLIINGGDEDQIVISANDDSRIFSFTEPGTKIILKNLSLRNGSAVDGGAIYASDTDLTLERVSLSNSNASGSGGAIYARSSRLVLDKSEVIENSAGINGGGVAVSDESDFTIFRQSTLSGNTVTGDGGGFYSSHSATPNSGVTKVLIIKSTIANNDAARGGAIFLTDNSNLSLGTSTLSGNTATSGFGGGVFVVQASTAIVNNSTIADNFAATGGGVFVGGVGSEISLYESIIADSTGSDCAAFASGSISIEKPSIIEDSTCGTSALSGDPNLDTLRDNGGLTKTHALLEGSIAIDAGDSNISLGSVCSPVQDEFGSMPTDQRGEPRTIGANCDLGAFEYQGTSSFYVIPTGNGKTVIFNL